MRPSWIGRISTGWCLSKNVRRRPSADRRPSSFDFAQDKSAAKAGKRIERIVIEESRGLSLKNFKKKRCLKFTALFSC